MSRAPTVACRQRGKVQERPEMVGEEPVPALGWKILLFTRSDLLTPKEGEVLVMEGERLGFESSSAAS